SHYGPDFYGLPRNTGSITLNKESWEVPESIKLPTNDDTALDEIVPFFAGETLQWKLA
ncbi:MAG: dihydroorotase, partial [Granulosicoccus sp.]